MLSFRLNPLRLNGITRPYHNDGFRSDQLFLDRFSKCFSTDKLGIPPHNKTSLFEMARQCNGNITVTLVVTQENIRHAQRPIIFVNYHPIKPILARRTRCVVVIASNSWMVACEPHSSTQFRKRFDTSTSDPGLGAETTRRLTGNASASPGSGLWRPARPDTAPSAPRGRGRVRRDSPRRIARCRAHRRRRSARHNCRPDAVP